MKLIVCLDDNNAMAFNNRRQSMDRVVKEKILERSGDHKLWMNTYSAKQFSSDNKSLVADDDYLNRAEENDYCFAETDDLLPFVGKVSEVVIFRWNRKYPSDLYFPAGIIDGLKLISTESFAGYSHEKVTKEVYRR